MREEVTCFVTAKLNTGFLKIAMNKRILHSMIKEKTNFNEGLFGEIKNFFNRKMDVPPNILKNKNFYFLYLL